MALKIEPNQSAVAYHITDGATLFRYAVDAQHAISNHPLEWRDTPWSRQDADASRAKLNERNADEGLEPLPDPPKLSPEDQDALDEHNKAVAAAAERLKAYYEKKAEDEKIAAQVAADEALVASVPPQPDPAVRRPLSPAQIRKQAAQLSPDEQRDLDRKNALETNPNQRAWDVDQQAAQADRNRAVTRKTDDDNARIAAEKAEQDRIGNAHINTIG